MEDQSILNRSTQETQTYLNDLAIAVCVNGDKLEKYEKVTTRQCGEEAFANMKLFVEEVQRSVEREKFTNTSKVNLSYLGKNAGLSESIVNKIIQHFEVEFGEVALWNQCRPNEKTDYKNYLDKYPNGKYASKARAVLAEIEMKEAIERAEREERNFWNNCQTSDKSGFQKYLDKYPYGKYASTARSIIADLERKEKEKEERENREQIVEQQMWDRCRTKDDFLRYLSLYPNGMYVNQARNKIAHLEKISSEIGSNNSKITDSGSEITMGNSKKKNKASLKAIMVCLISAIVLYAVAYLIRDEYENLGPFLCLASFFPYMFFSFEVVSNKKLGMAICITGWFIMMFFWSDYATQPTQSILPALGILGICSFFAVGAYLLLYSEKK